MPNPNPIPNPHPHLHPHPPLNTTLQPTDTVLLESFIPFYSLISRFLVSYFHIDPSHYVPYIFATAILAAATKYTVSRFTAFIQEYFVSTVEIPLDDEIYNYLMFWMAKQAFMKRTTHLVAGTKAGNYDDDEDEDEGEDSEREDEDGTGDSEEEEEEEEDFETYWARTQARDKYRRLRFAPAEGKLYFQFKGRMVLFKREIDEEKAFSPRSERLYLSAMGRNSTILRDLLIEAQRAYVERDEKKTVIYRGQKQYRYHDWTRCMARSPRPLSTVVLDEKQKTAFVTDLKEYLHPRTKRWYSNRGIPYRRGYLLHGPPGTGKTSLCAAAAGLLGLKLYLLSLNSGSLDEDGLMSLFQELPERCIVLLEDVDSAGMTQKRKENGSGGSTEEEKAKKAAAEAKKAGGSTEKEDGEKGGISLSALLNVIDGVAASEGRILVMTTNHAEKIDPALLRPGRVDMCITFGYASKDDVRDLFSSIYTSLEGDLPRSKMNGSKVNGAAEKVDLAKDCERVASLANEFAGRVPEGELTPAEIQGYLLNHKDRPVTALEGVEEWVRSVREEKENRDDTNVTG